MRWRSAYFVFDKRCWIASASRFPTGVEIRKVTPSLSQPDPLNKLLAALTDGETTPETFVGLQTRFSEDPAALGYYRRYMRLCAMLEFELAKEREQEGDWSEARNGRPASSDPSSFVVHSSFLRRPGPFVYRSAAFLCVRRSDFRRRDACRGPGRRRPVPASAPFAATPPNRGQRMPAASFSPRSRQ